MNISVRAAAIEDAHALAELSHQLGYPELSEAASAKNIRIISESDTDIVYVALDGDKVIGWIQLSFFVRMESGQFFEICGLVVDEQYRGKGIGKMLIEKGKEWCRQKGNYRLRVRSNVKRLDTHQFYLKAGFRELKEQKVFETDL